MNSYVNPSHEAAAAAVLREHLPDVYVTFSTDLTYEWYEYERCSTVAANAYVGPQVSTRPPARYRLKSSGVHRFALYDGF